MVRQVICTLLNEGYRGALTMLALLVTLLTQLPGPLRRALDLGVWGLKVWGLRVCGLKLRV